MKVNKSVEQAIYVLVILALQKDHAPVKSRVLSQILQVSDSYLKKILMVMKKNGLITSSASKHGGYQLARSIEGISIKDVFDALNLSNEQLELSHLAQHIFTDKVHTQQSEQKITHAFERAFDSFYQELDQFKLASLLKPSAYQNGVIDWNAHIK